MKKTKFTEQQIVFALKQGETGVPVAEVCRKMGISEATFYNWSIQRKSGNQSDSSEQANSFAHWYKSRRDRKTAH
jgi:putative transposase